MASRAMTAPTATPASTPFSFDPVETLRITTIRISVRIVSITNDWTAVPAGRVAPSVGCDGNMARKVEARQPGPDALADDVRHDPPGLEPAGGEEPDGDGGVQVAPGHVADGVDHRQHDQAEGEGHADVRDDAAAGVVDDDGPGPGEHQARTCRTTSAASFLIRRPRSRPRPGPSPRVRAAASSIRHHPCSSSPATHTSTSR